MLYTTDLSFVTIKQASKLTFGLLESFDTKYLRTENLEFSRFGLKPPTHPCNRKKSGKKNKNFIILK